MDIIDLRCKLEDRKGHTGIYLMQDNYEAKAKSSRLYPYTDLLEEYHENAKIPING